AAPVDVRSAYPNPDFVSAGERNPIIGFEDDCRVDHAGIALLVGLKACAGGVGIRGGSRSAPGKVLCREVKCAIAVLLDCCDSYRMLAKPEVRVGERDQVHGLEQDKLPAQSELVRVAAVDIDRAHPLMVRDFLGDRSIANCVRLPWTARLQSV